jgi:hypothetical protein
VPGGDRLGVIVAQDALPVGQQLFKQRDRSLHIP